MRILIFGDSIAQGFYDSKGGWVDRLKQEFLKNRIEDGREDTNPTIFNLGISGDMANNVVKRLALEVRARIWDSEPIAIVIAIGINDTKIYKGVESNTTEMFVGELQQLVAAALQYTDKLLFVGMTACDETKTKPVSWGDYTWTNERIWEFERALRGFCKENELPVVKVYEKFQGKRIDENLLFDGLHPNEAGHELIAGLVQQKLEELYSL